MLSSIWPARAGWLAAHWLAVTLSALALAAAYRERGQGHSWLGTTGARLLFWALPVGAIVYALSPHGSAWTAVLAGTAAFIGLVLVPHGAGQNLAVPWTEGPGTVWPADDNLRGIARPERLGYLLAAGVARLWLVSLPLIPDHPAVLWLPLAGIIPPLAYLLGLVMPRLSWRLTVATEWGEALSGAGIGAALAFTLVS